MIFSFMENNPYLSMILLTLLIWCPNMATMPLSIMEARNFITAREMVQDGHWILTTLNGLPRYEKPPLPTWLTALTGLVFGFKHLFLLRLPAMLMALFLAINTFRFCELVLKDRVQSMVASMILLSSFYTLGIVFEAPADIFTHGFMMAAIFYFTRLIQQKRIKWENAILSGVFIGCSILSKGPISLYVLFLPFLVAFSIRFKFPNNQNLPRYLFALTTIALITGCWWYLYVHVKDPETLSVVAAKETQNWSDYNIKPFYYYWTFFAETGIWTVPAFVGLLYPLFRNRIRAQQNYLFSLVWTLAAVLLLSIIPEKKTRYLMPVLIPLAINTSFYVKYLLDRYKHTAFQWEKSIVYFNFGLIGLICLLLPIGLCVFLGHEALRYTPFFIFYFPMLFVAGIALLNAIIRRNVKSLFATTVLVSILVYGGALPLYSLHTKSNDLYKLKDLQKYSQEHQITVYGDSLLSPEFIWYFGSSIPILSDEMDHSITQFGVISDSIFIQTKQDAGIIKSVAKLSKIDLNANTLKGKAHSARLIRSFYVIDNRHNSKEFIKFASH